MSSAMPNHRPRLSVAMIVRDEAEMLPRALDSVRGIADQIVVADTGSRDQTCRIAAGSGATVVTVPWHDDFSAARNQCLQHVNGDWILWLDGGERLSPRCAESLRSFIDGHPDTNQSWLLMVELPPHDAGESAERIGRIRLVPNRPDLRFTGRVRESLRPAIAAAKMTINIGPWRLQRTQRDHLPEIKRARAMRDLKLIEQEIQLHGAAPHLLVALGDACAALEQNDKALHYYRQAIATVERGSTEMLAAYYGMLTTLPNDSSLGGPQLELCIEALEVFPYDAQLLCAMGSYLQAQGHYSLAQRSYRAAHEFGQIDPETWHVGTIGEVAAECLCLNLQLLSDDAGALKVLDEAAQRYPHSPRLARRRMELHIKAGQLSEALAQIENLGLDASAREPLRNAIRGAAVASQKNWIAACAYLEAAFNAGCRDPLCLRWYTAALYSTGNYGRASEVLEQWSAVEPRCQELAWYRQALAQQAALPATPLAQGPPHRVPAPHVGPLASSTLPSTMASR
jgi:tetratricopeptide (TPR) repeat protein